MDGRWRESTERVLKNNLIDEYVVTITPHILGSGVPLFQDKNPEIHLTLTDTKRFGQFVNLYYKVK